MSAEQTEAGEESEIVMLTGRLLACALLGMPLLAVVLSETFTGPRLSQTFGRSLQWLQLALGSAVVLWGGWPIFETALGLLRQKKLSVLPLLSGAAIATYLYSVIAAFFPRLVANSAAGANVPPLYFELSAAIVILLLLGRILQLRWWPQPGRQDRR